MMLSFLSQQDVMPSYPEKQCFESMYPTLTFLVLKASGVSSNSGKSVDWISNTNSFF